MNHYCKSFHTFGECCPRDCVCFNCFFLFSGQKIQSSVERMFRIWRDRKVYDKAFVKQLDQLLSGETSEKGTPELNLCPVRQCLSHRTHWRDKD